MDGDMPSRQGLYDPRYEHDACGVAFVVDVHGRATAEIVAKGLTALRNLDHRGASGSDPKVGDGAGMLVQVPDAFFRAVTTFPLPDHGSYAVGIGFLPREALKILGLVAAEGLCGLEVVEVSPPYDTSDITALFGTRVVVEALGSMVAHGKLGSHKHMIDKPVTY